MRSTIGELGGRWRWRVAPAAATLWLVLGVAQAHAGTWMQASCVNPDGSAAGSAGWSGYALGAPANGSIIDSQCGPGQPMEGSLTAVSPVPVGSSEVLRYTAPDGSTLAGGSVSVGMSANGGGASASAVAALYEPNLAYDGSDVFFQCANVASGACSAAGPDFTGTLALPAGRGGSVYADAECGGSAGGSCSTAGPDGSIATVRVSAARLLLSSDSSPTGTGFSGTVTQRGVHGTGSLLFSAGDTGPGVYHVTAFIDHRVAEVITPNLNGGPCQPVGTDAASGALIFDSAQPCPTSTAVDLPVPTAGLSDGSHELTVAVTDAAQNTAVVFDQLISTSNPQRTPVPSGRRTLHAQFVISWSWKGRVTRLRSIAIRRPPRSASVRLSCAGRSCPKVPAAGSRRVGPLLRSLDGRRFRAGDRLLITVSAPGHAPEQIRLTVRNNRIPAATLLHR